MAESYSRQRQESPSVEPALRVAITGGTAGVGLALVREFHRRGARSPSSRAEGSAPSLWHAKFPGRPGSSAVWRANRTSTPAPLESSAGAGGAAAPGTTPPD